MKKKKLLGSTLVLALMFSACGPEENGSSQEKDAPPATETTEVTNVTAAEASKLIAETDNLVVLDVRTPAEFAEGHIKGAINIDVKQESFDEEVAKLDTATPYVIHCRSGSRSAKALSQMEAMPFKKIYHLDSGFLGWQEAGLPVEK